MRTALLITTAAAAAAALAGCMSDETAATAPTRMYAAEPPPATPRAMPTAAMDYLVMAGAGDQFEIQSSTIAVQRTQRAEVRQFAQMMIDHHSKSTADLVAAAKGAGITPPAPRLRADQDRMIAGLRDSGTGADFEMAYLRGQLQAHREALMLHQTYAQSGDNPALRAAAARIVPVVQMHLEHLQRLTG